MIKFIKTLFSNVLTSTLSLLLADTLIKLLTLSPPSIEHVYVNSSEPINIFFQMIAL